MRVVFELYFKDLNDEKQEEIVNSLKEIIREENKKEGEQIMSRQWHDPKPQDWQEAYVREYAIDYIMWDEYVENFGDSQLSDTVERPNFSEIYEDYLENKAREVAISEIRHIGADVEI